MNSTQKIPAEQVTKGMFIVGRGYVTEVHVYPDVVANMGQAKQPKKEQRHDKFSYEKAVAYEHKVQYRAGQTGRVSLVGVGFRLSVDMGTEVTIFVQPTTPILVTSAKVAEETRQLQAA